MILVRNALVMRESGLTPGDVLVGVDGVVAVGADLGGADAVVVDAAGAVLGPGFVDLHSHFRDPGQTWKEDLESGSRAALAGGFTAVVVMPNTDPVLDTGERATAVADRGRALGLVDIQVAGALTMGSEGERMADLESLYHSGVRIFTDDGRSPSDAGLLREIMRYLAGMPEAVVADHPEDAALSRHGHLHEGVVAARHGIGAIPASAEEVAVARDLLLAAETGARLHLQHLSTRGSVAQLRRAKEDGVSVTAEVTPHHLSLTDSDTDDLDPDLKMYPPLRHPTDTEALRSALAEGLIDAVATDHAPHTTDEKDVPFEEAPRGVIGLETAAAVTLAALGGDVSALFQRLSVMPARIAGMTGQGRLVEVGSPSNLVIFDPRQSWVPDRFHSKSSNSPFRGRTLTGRVVATVSRGRLLYREDEDV